MAIKTKLLILYALFHLAMVLKGALQFGAHPYQIITGTSYSFSFFAPTIGTETRVLFDLIDKKGSTTRTVSLRDGLPNELKLRIGGIVNTLRDPDLSKDARRALAASWAGQVLAEFPESPEVLLRVEKYDLPSMRGARNGKLLGWTTVETMRFRRF